MTTPDKDNKLEEIIVPINKGQWLNQALEADGYKDGNIPTDMFLNKVEPGAGATHGELIAERHSIIIEPPVPAVVGKTVNNPDYRAVYQGTTKEDVKKYLQRTDVEYKKIITTPEGYVDKVVPAMKELKIDYHKEYFCLYDECEKLVQDSGYRGAISIPIKDFFKYKGKAYVSATPIKPRSSIFKKHGFKWMTIQPTYDYKKDATLMITRSFNRTVKGEILKRVESGQPLCVFYKTTKGINKLLTWLLDEGIIKEGDYKVFCSKKSVQALKDARFRSSYDQIDLPLAKIDFFTSRFFSAFDLIVTKIYDILVLSNYREARHSIIDPFTEAVQIQGRFRKVQRNDKRYGSLTFITNIDEKFEVKSDEEVTKELEAYEDQYEKINELYKSESDKTKKSKHLKQLKKMMYSELLDADGEPDPFKVDQRYDEERVKSYYTDQYKLKQAYEDTGHFNITFIPESEVIGEDDKMELSQVSRKDRWKLIVDHIERMENAKLHNEAFQYDEAIEFIRKAYRDDEFIIDAYFKIGRAAIESASWGKGKIDKELIAYSLQESQKLRFSPDVLASIEEEFQHEVDTKCFISKEEFIDRLSQIYKAYGITYKVYGDGQNGCNAACTLTHNTVHDYFEATVHNGKEPPSYILERFKSELVRNLQRGI